MIFAACTPYNRPELIGYRAIETRACVFGFVYIYSGYRVHFTPCLRERERNFAYLAKDIFSSVPIPCAHVYTK